MLRRLVSYWPTAKKEIAIGGLLLVFAAGMELLQPWPIKWLVDYVFGSREAPRWLKTTWAAFANHDAAGGIAAVCISILVLAIIGAGLIIWGGTLLRRAYGQGSVEASGAGFSIKAPTMLNSEDGRLPLSPTV